MKARFILIAGLALPCLLAGHSATTAASADEAMPPHKSYQVNKKVADFPTGEDLSTPEAAYASLHRAWAAEGEAVWKRLSVRRLSDQFGKGKSEPLPPKRAESLLQVEVIDVHYYNDKQAVVFAKLEDAIDLRTFGCENGRWLNMGESVSGTLEGARALFIRFYSIDEAKRVLASRPPIENPDQHLNPFVDFLKQEARDPHEFLMKVLADKQLVILGEVHHRPRYWAFNCSLVKAADFPRRVGVIYMELPYNDQPLIDQFLAADKYDPQPVIEMLRNIFWMGWPDQSMLDFFKTVWEVNQQLPTQQRLRVVLVDMARPWKNIEKRGDWRQYEVDRNQLMADNVVKDLREHAADPRHALFIVGYMHAMQIGPKGAPEKSAGCHLKEELGKENIFAVFPHSPVIANMGGVGGRIALGLFESAFAALDNRPMAFPLDHGPFGEQIFDASLDDPTTEPFHNAFQAYLYLGPVENEVFSSIINGFYSDDFLQEMDRRYRLMNGQGLKKGCNLASLDGESFVRWMSSSWGQPRWDWSSSSLGPLDAWKMGADWEKKMAEDKTQNWINDESEKKAIKKTAARLFEAIEKADYENPGDWQRFPAPDVDYTVNRAYDIWMQWICKHFRTNPIVAVDLGGVEKLNDGRPAVPYKLTLKDGTKLEGTLPFQYNSKRHQWGGVEGIDWHLRGRNN
jgi:uncharacterized iron-regulated protein